MKCHKEYKHLAEIMDPVRNKFATLKDRMLLYPKGSNEYKVYIIYFIKYFLLILFITYIIVDFRKTNFTRI
jgi:hypothetical protein